jgi:hypothetical protein
MDGPALYQDQGGAEQAAYGKHGHAVAGLGLADDAEDDVGQLG